MTLGSIDMTLNALAVRAHENAVAHGFYDNGITFAEQIALMHSELSEALEELRDGNGITETYYRQDGKPEGVPYELADVIIRVLDCCGCYGIDIEWAVKEKMAYNEGRPYKHGKVM